MATKRRSRGTVAVAGALGLMAGAFVAFGYGPYWHEARRIEGQVAERRAGNAETLVLAERLLDRTRRAQLIELEVRNYERLVPDNKDLGSFLGQLSGELQDAGLKDTAVRALAATRLGKCEQLPIEVRGSGTFAQVHRFLTRLEGMQRLSSVSRLYMDADPAMTGRVSVEITLSIYSTRTN